MSTVVVLSLGIMGNFLPFACIDFSKVCMQKYFESSEALPANFLFFFFFLYF